MEQKYKLLMISIFFIMAISCSKTEENQQEVSKYGDQNLWEIEHGHSQSPININEESAEIKQDLGIIELKISNEVSEIYDTGYTIQVEGSGQSTINGRIFDFLQAHFHTPGEHTINGISYPAELHFVHQAQNGRLAVLGSLFIEGEPNDILQTILDNVGKDVSSLSIDLRSLLPSNLSYYHYLGSLTTPPLTENVDWYVMKNSIEISSSQIKQLQEFHKRANNRHVQDLNGRKVLTKDKN